MAGRAAAAPAGLAKPQGNASAGDETRAFHQGRSKSLQTIPRPAVAQAGQPRMGRSYCRGHARCRAGDQAARPDLSASRGREAVGGSAVSVDAHVMSL
jgi:hypothetical protein